MLQAKRKRTLAWDEEHVSTLKLRFLLSCAYQDVAMHVPALPGTIFIAESGDRAEVNM
jgi:hypothetical protein